MAKFDFTNGQNFQVLFNRETPSDGNFLSPLRNDCPTCPQDDDPPSTAGHLTDGEEDTTFSINTELTLVNDEPPGETLAVYFLGTYEHEGVTLVLVTPTEGPFPDGSEGDYPSDFRNAFEYQPVSALGPVPDGYTFPDRIYINDVTQQDFVVCFATGTLIATPSGERAVETLAPGDPVLTADGRVVPVRWVGRQTRHRLFSPPERFQPVRIRAGALADGVPRRDLVLTADHAVAVDGILANAGALVDGRAIERVPSAELPEQVVYWHVETPSHALLLAEGAPAESFVDNVGRRAFDNHRDWRPLPGETGTWIPEMPLPRAMSRRQLPRRIAERLAARSAARFGRAARTA